MPFARHDDAPHAADDAARAADADLGPLPEWNLADLYAAMDAPEVRADMDKALGWAKSFEDSTKGKLAGLAEAGAAGRLAELIVEYEALQDLLGRLVSFAGLVYSGDTTDPKRSKSRTSSPSILIGERPGASSALST